MARKMKDSGVEWIGLIPDEWMVKRAKYMFNQTNGKGNDNPILLSATQQYGMYPQSKIEGVVKVNENTDLQLFKTVHIDDFVISLRSFQGGFEHSAYEGVCSPAYQTFHAIVPIETRYFKYFFKSTNFIDAMNALTVGIREGKNINYDDFANSVIVYPSLREQQRIADYLDAKCASIDEVIAKTNDSIEEYKKLKQAVITEAVTKGVRGNRPMKDSGIDWIGQIPSDWFVHRVKRLLRERKERSESGLEEPLSMSQVLGLVPTKMLDSIPNMASSFVGAKLAFVGDLVFNKLKAHLGVFSVSRYDGLVSPDYAVYYGTGLVDLNYLEFLFKTPQCIHEFKKRITGVGAGLSRLYTDDLFSISCAIPSIDEQKEISHYLLKKRTEIDTLISQKQQFVDELTAYKKSLIYEYVTGKKEVPA